MWGKKNIVDVRNIAQMFDLSFMRGFKYAGSNSIDPNWYSHYCNSHRNEP